MSVPLLLERSKVGKGPKIPVRLPYQTIVVEGLKLECSVGVFQDGEYLDGFTKDGRYTLDQPLNVGSVVQVELFGENSCVSVLLER